MMTFSFHISIRFFIRMNAIFGNIEDIKEFHKAVVLPMLEKALKDSNILR